MKGLRNAGPCCATNSVVQVLYATTPLRQWCADQAGHATEGTVVSALCKLFRDMGSEDGPVLPNTRPLKLATVKYADVEPEHFEDPYSVLTYILNGLHDQDERKTGLAQMWTIVKRSTVRCMNCEWFAESRMRVPTLWILPDTEPTTLQDQVDQDENHVITDYVCGECKTNADLCKTETVVETSDVLCVTINRIDRPVALDMEPTKNITSVRFENKLVVNGYAYALYAVITHLGHVQRGRTRAYVRHEDEWFYADDARVTQCQWSDITLTRGSSCNVGEVACMLMYQRCS